MNEDHYFSADPAAPFQRAAVRAVGLGARPRPHQWLRGLRAGSARHRYVGAVPRDRAAGGGRILDLGCGYGVIGLAICVGRAATSTTVTAVDVNRRAVLLANENAEALGVTDRFRAVTPEEVPAGETYDEIWSNPPIRIGKAALHDLLLTWLPRLAPGGRAVMVVGKNLGADSLQRWLGEQGYPTERLASAKGFRVLETRAAPTA